MSQSLAPRLLQQNSKKFIASKVDDELILVHGDTGAFYALDNVGLTIWDCIEEPKALDDISQHLQLQYEVDEAECNLALQKFADDLVRAGLAEFT